MGKYVYSMPNGKASSDNNDVVYEIRSCRVARLIFWFIGIFVFLCFAWLYVLHNLWSNSVYYAKNTPSSKVVAPEIVMLLENLEYIRRPEISGINYDFDGNNTIMNCVVPDAKACVYLGEYPDGYQYNISDHEFYELDSDLNLMSASDWTDFNGEESRKIPNNEVNLDKLYKDIYEAAMPVLEANQEEPNLNLQWIFDWYYYDVFN